MSRNSGHDDNDNEDVYNLGDISETPDSSTSHDHAHDDVDEGTDEGARFNEATVVRPRSVLDDAFDAHTVVRPESARRLPSAPAAPASPPPTPTASQATSQTPPPSTQARTVKDAVTSPSISKRFRRDASVTNFPIPPSIHFELPKDKSEDSSEEKPENKPENKPAGPTPAQIAQAQAVALAQENARQKAEQAAKQAAAQEAARRAQQQQEHQQKKAAAAATAPKSESAAKQEAPRRERQTAQASPPPVSENAGPFRFEDTQSNFKLEPARRKFDFKVIAAVVVLAVVGAYIVFGSGGSESGSGRPNTESSKMSGQRDFASTLNSPPASSPAVHDGSPAGSQQATSELVASPPGAAVAGPTANVLAGFDDAFSRTQVRSRPDSRD